MIIYRTLTICFFTGGYYEISRIFPYYALQDSNWNRQFHYLGITLFCPSGRWQDQDPGADRQIREIENYFLKREEERDAQHKKELKEKEREISYLRSKVYRMR